MVSPDRIQLQFTLLCLVLPRPLLEQPDHCLTRLPLAALVPAVDDRGGGRGSRTDRGPLVLGTGVQR